MVEGGGGGKRAATIENKQRVLVFGGGDGGGGKRAATIDNEHALARF